MRNVPEVLLSTAGYKADLAKTGEEGLEMYTRRAFDVVLLDVSMPGMGGSGDSRRAFENYSDAIVLMIT